MAGQKDMVGLGQTDMEVLDVQKLNMFVILSDCEK
jgi:hypothetical protein